MIAWYRIRFGGNNFPTNHPELWGKLGLGVDGYAIYGS